MTTLPVLTVYCLLIVAASLIGGKLPNLIKLNHKRMQILISFVGGLMLGIGLFHMLPHAIVQLSIENIDQVVVAVMLGIVVIFFLLRMFHFHHHDPEQLPTETCDHEDHKHHHSHKPGHSLSKEMSWIGVFMGLSLHTLIDGFALGASIQGDALQNSTSFFLGLGTFTAILLHKPLDALSITSLMRASNWSTKSQLLVNGAFSLMCPIGAFLFVSGASLMSGQQSQIVGIVLAFSAGVFICISLSDLLPEMEFHSHHRIPLSLALVLGVFLAWGIRYLEPAHAHGPKIDEDEIVNPVEFLENRHK